MRSVNAIGVVISQTQEAHRRGEVTEALLRAVAADFPTAARRCLPRKLRVRNVEIDENLVQRADSFVQG